MTAYVLLEDGTRFDGDAVGADTHAVGEVVFTTGMSGYQESMTDPSFAGQLITFTYPHIGNYGVRAAAMESDRPWARAAIMREANDTDDAPGAEDGWLRWLRANGIPAITGVDTRSLVLHIRDEGAMRGGVFPESIPRRGRALIDAEPSMVGRDLVQDVTPREVTIHGYGDGPRIVAIDTGIKGSIVRNFTERGAIVELHPARTTAEELVARGGDAIFLANGPGDPARWTTSSTPCARSSAGSQRSASASATSCCAGRWGWTRSSSRLATAAATTPSRTWRPVASRSRRRTTASRSSGRTASSASRPTRPCAGTPLRQGAPQPREPPGPDRRRAPRCSTSPAAPCSTTRRRAPARTTPCISSTASWRPSVPAA